jgi:transposase-like protein
VQSELDVAHFANEEAAIAYVEKRLWPDGPVCPHCGTIGEATRSRGKTTRLGLWNCRACRKPFTVKIKTVFESSHVPLHVWLQTIYLFCSSKKGFATRQLQRTLGCSMKTAWFLGIAFAKQCVISVSPMPIRSAAQIRWSRQTKLISAAERLTAKGRSRQRPLCCRLSSAAARCAASMYRT